MKEHTNIQIIKDGRGIPTFVVIPYTEYSELIGKYPIDTEHGVPSEIVKLVLLKGYNPALAWREYLELTQEEVAKRIGVTQAAYSKFEKSARLRKPTRVKIANAFGIAQEQLDF